MEGWRDAEATNWTLSSLNFGNKNPSLLHQRGEHVMFAFDEIGAFTMALLNHYIAWGTGSLIVLLLFVAGLVKNWHIPNWVYIAFLLLGFLTSAFQAWQDQYKENEVGRMAGSLYLNGLEIKKFRFDNQPITDKSGTIQVGLRFTNKQDRLIEYHVDKLSVTIDSMSADISRLPGRTVYAYPGSESIFRAPDIQKLPDVLKSPVEGEIDYSISYHVVGSKEVHHTSKNVSFSLYSSGDQSTSYRDEHED